MIEVFLVRDRLAFELGFDRMSRDREDATVTTALDRPSGLRIDTSALTRPVSLEDVRRFVRADPETFGFGPRWIGRRLRDVLAVVVGLVLAAPLVMCGLFFLLLVVLAAFGPTVTLAAVVGWSVAPLALLLIVLAVRWLIDGVREVVLPPRRPRRAFRLSRFAAENGLRHVGVLRDPIRAGSPFSAGSSRSARDVISAPDGALEIGNLVIAGGMPTGRVLRRIGYVRIRLPQAMPHLVLEPRAFAWPWRRRIPWQFRGTRMTLAADPARRYRLHVAPGYETTALGLLTADFLAVLLEHAGKASLEIVDDSLYLYSRTTFDMAAPDTYMRLIPVAAAVWYPTAGYTARWSDAYTVDGRLGAQGRRLAAAFPIGAAIAAVYFAAMVVRLIVVAAQL